MNRSRQWLIVFLLLASFLAAGYFVLWSRFEAGKDMPEYSVYSRDRDGYKTAARVLHQLGFQPVALSRPIQNTHYHGLLIMVEPQHFNLMLGFQPGLGESDSRGLLAWVGKGNTLVLASSHWTPIHEMLGITLLPGKKDKHKVFLAEASEVGGYTEPLAGQTMRVDYLGVEGHAHLQGKTGVPLWMRGAEAGAWLVPWQNGRVIFIADPSLWTHRRLAQQDNVLLLYNIARLDAAAGQVFFDEYHHGIRSGGSYWDYLRYHNLHWIALQVLLVIGIAMWAVSVRLGPPVPIPPPARADAVDYASAVARIYQRAGVLHQMAENIARDFLAELTRLLHLRRTARPAEILKTWQQRHGRDFSDELATLLDAAEHMRTNNAPNRPYSRSELLHWTRRFDDFLGRHRPTRTQPAK